MTEIIIVNAQTIAVGLVSIYLISKKIKDQRKVVPIIGLTLIILSGILGIASWEFSRSALEALTVSTKVGLYIHTNVIGLLNSIGLICLVYSILNNFKIDTK